MPLHRHARDWEDLAKLDPHWAIYSNPARKHGRWDLDAFFATGARDIAKVLAAADRLGRPLDRGAALDFGCGIGRLTRALQPHFARCVGVDISAEMVRQARAVAPECEFVVNTQSRLPFADATFDLAYTQWVLQHQPTVELIKTYVAELVRVTRPGGLLVFQFRTGLSLRARLQIGRRLYAFLRAAGVPERVLYQRLRLNPIRMTVLPEAEMQAFVEGLGARVLEVLRYSGVSGAGCIFHVTR